MTEAVRHEFHAETQKVLRILTHSLYTDREIFLRELISNASDALDKLRYHQASGTVPASFDASMPLEIRLSADKAARTLTVSDTGIGMTEEELVRNLGTIAHSGSEDFMQAVGDKPEASSIIGRFGIGFYSVFMVADRVEVLTRSFEEGSRALRWSSDGTGSYEIEEVEDCSWKRGTEIRAWLKEDASEFLEDFRLESIVRKHSAFVPFPVLLGDKRLNTTPALWREPRFSVTKEQYADFYKFLTGEETEPLDTLHLSVDVPTQFSALLFVPGTEQRNFGPYNDHWGLDLYVRRVMIRREDKNLLPDWLGFIKGVVDTEDLPLNISRETLQENRILRGISQALIKQLLGRFEKTAQDTPEEYEKFWNLHGKVFKLGYSDFLHRDRIVPLLRFNSSAFDAQTKLTSLDGYIERAKEGQKEIWYLAASGREGAVSSPYMETFLRKGIEVLYLYEPVDEFALESIGKYKDFTFKAVEHADSSVLDAFADKEAKTGGAEALQEDELSAFDSLVASMRTLLGDQVKDVRVSHRLTDSPACLVADDGVTSSMDRLMRVMQKDETIPKKIFEVNRDHPLLRNMLKMYRNDASDANLEDMVRQLFDMTLLLDGYMRDPHDLVQRMNRTLEKASALYAKNEK
ncbi:MAG: molecular chaperone HtpG [Desulfovibrionaceae bacterium]|nr:molecular chaperone HtpG [Desulfovibrionaceae bacterium]